jgi:deoxyhypusine monooxygenase
LYFIIGEALGAIASPNVKEILEEYADDPVIEVAETCQLALSRLKWLADSAQSEKVSENPYACVDPAPPSQESDTTVLKQMLQNESLNLFDRYRAMFSLRNLNTPESVRALAEGMWYNGHCMLVLYVNLIYEICYCAGCVYMPHT